MTNATETAFIEPTKYRLQSMATGRIFDDAGWTLDAPGEDQTGLIRAVYAKKKLTRGHDSAGLYCFADWLPISRTLEGSSAPVTYKSTALGKKLGLQHLYITFSGYWPERNADMKSCSFKETEAYAVGGRLKGMDGKVLVVASAGNTARAFARVCSDNQIPLLLCVPGDYVQDALWFDKPLHPCVKLIVTAPGSDYFDAIHLSNLVCQLDNFLPEGGAKNIARRDGMGTTVLSAATHIGRIPDYYFQAIGSGTGAIAAWEANLRLIVDGRFGSHKMKLMVSQNAPFLPIYRAWKAASRQLMPYNDVEARRHVEAIDAKVLSNRKPPYPLAGGLFDALTDTDGDVLAVENKAAAQAASLFSELEGIDIHPAAAVATASLLEAVENERINNDAVVMLNITGGGETRFRAEKKLHFLKPELIFGVDLKPEEVQKQVASLRF